MEISVLNIKGEDTGKKVALNESVFGVEPNDHAIYLDVKQYLAAQRQGTAKSKERSENVRFDSQARSPERRWRCASR